VLSLNELGFNPDAKEAILFALLANEAVAGEAMQIGGNATKKPITMGKISFPD
jgi:anhydro-N-acetylmuramic acid kinase